MALVTPSLVVIGCRVNVSDDVYVLVTGADVSAIDDIVKGMWMSHLENAHYNQ